MKLLSLLLGCVLLAGVCQAFDSWNKPSRMLGTTTSYVKSLLALPKAGKTANTPWSDSYWPSYQGGIAYRWNSPNTWPNTFGYKLYTRRQLFKLSPAKMKALSPAEKYDIYMNRMDYPTVKGEWGRTRPNAPSWEGICHGWAPAAEMYYQPNAVNFRLSDGLVLYFGSSDVKALLSYFLGVYANARQGTKHSIGQRCTAGSGFVCGGPNAGAFQIVLANMLGLRGQSFIIDIDNSYQVWNQPVDAFRTSVNGNTVTTKLSYTVETPANWNAQTPKTESRTIRSYLHLAGTNRNIVGGQWLSTGRIDFAWKIPTPAFGGYMAGLANIYSSSLSSGYSVASRHDSEGNAGDYGWLGPWCWEHPTNETCRGTAEEMVWDYSALTPEHVPLVGETVDWDEASAGKFSEHAVLSEPSGFLSAAVTPGMRSSWSIAPLSNHTNQVITLHFDGLDLSRKEAWVKIYDEATCDGPLLNVVSGRDVPEDMTFTSPFCVALVTKDVDSVQGEFAAHYHVEGV